ncbi:MAG: cadherin repeat domain-containing protein, partial [Bacteroidetes bacterium]|nr:cadherin repeat domain-containing protein [Bacteroidota bacterium]
MKRLILATITLSFLLIGCNTEDDTPTEDQLIFEDTRVSFKENPTKSALITTFSAESDSRVQYKLISQSPFGAVEVDRNTGQVRVLETFAFNFEINPVIRVTVQASIGSNVKNANLFIELEDVEIETSYNGSVRLRSQEDVDFFGANNYLSVTGSLRIDGPPNDGESPITDLSPLLSITDVGIDLAVEDNTLLNTLHGLENITNIGEKVEIEENESLTDISALSDITIRLGLRIKENPSLNSMKGLANVIVDDGDISITENNTLREIEGFESTIALRSLTISNNELLTSLKGFDLLEFINSDLVIFNNNNITSLDAFFNLSSVGGDVRIIDNHSLSNMDSLSTLQFIAGSIVLENNPVLTNLDGL